MYRKVNSFDVCFESLLKYVVNMCNCILVILRLRGMCDNFGYY